MGSVYKTMLRAAVMTGPDRQDGGCRLLSWMDQTEETIPVRWWMFLETESQERPD